MRLTAEQQRDIRDLVRTHIGTDAEVSIYGSRVRDAARGGDVDLFIDAPQHVPPMQRAALQLALQDRLCLPVDLLFAERGKPLSPFQSLAKAQAQPLHETAK
jgi:predicted nucleotidyltransferase